MTNDTYHLHITEDTITQMGLENSSSNLIPKNTVITATRMGLGKAFINSVEMAINQDLKALIPNEKIDNKYLYLSILQNKEIIEGLGTGATVKGIKLATLRSIKFKLPPLPTQQKIASVLSAYDDLIENNLKRIEVLEEMAQQTYEEWFVRMKYPGYESDEINPETGLPEGWERVELCHVAKINQTNLKRGFAGRIKYIDISSVSTNQVNETVEYEFNEAPGRARRVVKNGDIIWSCVRPNRRSHALIINPDKNLIASTGFCVISAEKVSFAYLYQALITDEFVGYLTNLAGGAAYPAVKQIHFEKAEILLPSVMLLNEFTNIFEPTKYIINNLQSQNQHLREARDLLLPRLMMGLIDVEEILES